MSVVLVLSIVGVIMYKKNKATGSALVGEAVAPEAEVEQFMKDIPTWLPEWRNKIRAYFLVLPKTEWDKFYPYWSQYHVTGKGGEAPAGMMDAFQIVVNRAADAGAWPPSPAS